MVSEIGLALSGGGVRGVAHLGLIKALEENNIAIKAISGTSAGSIVAAFYASGYSVDDILDVILNIKAIKLLRPALSKTGLLKMNNLYKALEELLPKNDFSGLSIPVTISATNIRTGLTEYFDEGDLIGAVCSSSCIPVLFDPFEHNGQLYIDGGILNNLPAEPLVGKVDCIMGSHCNPIDRDFDPRNARLVMERALMLSITKNSYQSKSICDYFFEPKGLEPFKVMDIGQAKEVYDIGYRQAIEQLEHLGLTTI
ncbi:MAG: patatin-like phospholipase family protein [Bacteroidota bacterium]